MTRPRFEHLGDDQRYQGYLWRVAVGTFRDPMGREFTRDVVRSPGAVGVLPMWRDARGEVKVLLIRQYRPVLDRAMTEIPAGMRDVPGEDPATTAVRELAEEAGLHADRLHLVTELVPSPGMSDGTTVVYLATGLTSVPAQAHGVEEEYLEVLEMSLDEAVVAVDRGEITDAKTVVAVLAAQRRVATGSLEIPSR